MSVNPVSAVIQWQTALPAVEKVLQQALFDPRDQAPPRLAEALLAAVFPGGSRLRPSLCLAIGSAHGGSESSLIRAAAAIELVHCASLVHDDMPCFDNAATRRGAPSIHAAYGEAMALLVGDGLIIQAFRVLATGEQPPPVDVLAHLARMAGPHHGLVAGQAWELETVQFPGLRAYHRCKTAALFEFAGYAGAACVGVAPEPWAKFGQRVGLAYQLVDDLVDCLDDGEGIGKPKGQDALHGRPNAVDVEGLLPTVERLQQTFECLHQEIPCCARPLELLSWLHDFHQRVAPYVLRASRQLDARQAPAQRYLLPAFASDPRI